MSIKLVVAALAALFLSEAAAAQSMNAQSFYLRANALQKKGMLALFSGDLKPLMNEGQAAGLRAKQMREADLAAHRKPRFCPPPGVVKIGNDEFMQRLSAIPASERAHIDMTEATTRILAAKFPCRA